MSTEMFDRLKTYVSPGASVVSATDNAFIQACLDEAVALVDNFAGIGIDRVPVAILQRAYVETGSELYARRSAPMGISQFASPDGAAIRVGRDPLSVARTILQPYLPGGFA